MVVEVFLVCSLILKISHSKLTKGHIDQKPTTSDSFMNLRIYDTRLRNMFFIVRLTKYSIGNFCFSNWQPEIGVIFYWLGSNFIPVFRYFFHFFLYFFSFFIISGGRKLFTTAIVSIFSYHVKF